MENSIKTEKMARNLKHRPIMFIISSPSGCGKTTLAGALLAEDKRIKRSVSVTTRPKRKGEVNGKDYWFVNQGKFNEMVTRDMFIEHAKVFGNFYGTPKRQTEQLFKAGLDVMYVIDWQGGLRLMRKLKKEAVSVFILPPSIKILTKRLKGRASDSPEVIERRLALAQTEISKCKYYDYIIINDTVEEAIAQLKSILNAERLKQKRYPVDNCGYLLKR